MKNATVNLEKKVRQFVRAAFAARVVKIDGVGQCTTTKNSARVLIRNPNRVFEVLQEKFGKPVEKGNTVTFKVAKVGTVALVHSGNNAVLHLVTAQ
jgi:hypothetical protein